MNKYVMVSFYNCNYQVKVNTLSNQIVLEEKNLGKHMDMILYLQKEIMKN